MSFKTNKYLFIIINIMLSEIIEFGIIMYYFYETYKNVNFNIDELQLIKYLENTKNEYEYNYKTKENNSTDKWIMLFEKEAIKFVLLIINLKNMVTNENPFFCKINKNVSTLSKSLFNKFDKSVTKHEQMLDKLKIKGLSKKNNLVHSSDFEEIVNSSYEEHTSSLIDNKEEKENEEKNDLNHMPLTLDEFVEEEEIIIDDVIENNKETNEIKETEMKIKEEAKEEIKEIEERKEETTEENKEKSEQIKNRIKKIKINNDIPDEVDLCEIDFGENINKILDEGKKEDNNKIEKEKNIEKIKIKVGKKKKIK